MYVQNKILIMLYLKAYFSFSHYFATYPLSQIRNSFFRTIFSANYFLLIRTILVQIPIRTILVQEQEHLTCLLRTSNLVCLAPAEGWDLT